VTSVRTGEAGQRWRIMVIQDNLQDGVDLLRLLLTGSQRRLILEEAATAASELAAIWAGPIEPPGLTRAGENAVER
jgi:hypothetical protein